MLKEQQNILALLGEKGKFLNNNLQYDPQDMIHVLEQLEEQRKILKPTKENNKELKHLKIDIQEAIGALNKTSEGTDNEKDKELKLEYEIKQQKEEIEMLKDLVEQILEKQDKLKNKYKKDKKKDKKVITSNNSTSSEEDKSSEEKRESEDDILGVSLFLQPLVNKPPPRERESNMKDLKKENVENKDKEQFFNQKNPPDGKKDQEKTKKETTDVDNKATNEQSNAKSIRYDDPKVSLVKSNERSTHYEEPNLPSRKSEARASSLESDISQFLDEIDGNKKPDMEEQLKELEEKFIKQTREEKIKRELARLRKLIGKNNEDEKAGSKSLPQNEDVEFLKRLETLMKSRGRDIKVEEKPTDSIREELKKLQSAIDKLKPKEDVSPEVKEHPKIGPEAKELPDEVKIDQEAVLQLSTHQLRQLRNKIDEILRIQEGSAKHSIIPEISSKAPLKPIIDTKKAGPYPSWYKGSTSEPCSPYDYPYRPFNSPQHSPFSPPHGLKHIGDNEILPNFSNGGPSSFLDRSLMEKDIRSPYFQNDRSVAEFNYGPEGTERYIPQQPDYYPMPINYNDMDIPPYNGMYYEQSGINRLEQEIQELKAIISSGNKDKTPKPSFSPEIQSHPKRYKRSLDESRPPRQERSPEVSSSSSDMQLFDDVTSKLREYFLEENSKGRTAADTRETGFNEITDRLNKLKSQRSYSSNK
ncbi:uncharacterized protein [Diabrotica undecimpunctata]|uniref:uncharacterized protein isoform X2 n=1 Tax=Diabrotica undecimpunctata TaxID=50387 RepID=UPI003B6378AC